MIRNTFILILIGLIFASCKKNSPNTPIKNTGLLVTKLNFDNETTVTNAYKFFASTGLQVDSYIIQNIDSLTVGTNVTRLKAQFTIENKKIQVKVNGVLQISAITENDFTYPVIYQAYFENGDVQIIKVIVNVAKTSVTMRYRHGMMTRWPH